ncbi:hypothetical protein RI367_004335 [Sorochytrium milnesiophthora]
MTSLVALTVAAAFMYNDAREKLCSAVASVESTKATRTRAARYEPFARWGASLPDLQEWVLEHPSADGNSYLADATASGSIAATTTTTTTAAAVVEQSIAAEAEEQGLPGLPPITLQLGERVSLPVNAATAEHLAERFANTVHDQVADHIPTVLLRAGGVVGTESDPTTKFLPKLERFAADSLPFPRASLPRRVFGWLVDVAALSLLTAPIKGSMKTTLFVLGWAGRDLWLGYWGLQSPGRFLAGQVLLSTHAARQVIKASRDGTIAAANSSNSGVLLLPHSTDAAAAAAASIPPSLMPQLQQHDIFAALSASSLRYFISAFSPFSLLAYGFVSVYTVPALVSGDGRSWWDRFTGVQVVDREVYLYWARTGRILEQVPQRGRRSSTSSEKRRSWVVRLDVTPHGEDVHQEAIAAVEQEAAAAAAAAQHDNIAMSSAVNIDSGSPSSGSLRRRSSFSALRDQPSSSHSPTRPSLASVGLYPSTSEPLSASSMSFFGQTEAVTHELAPAQDTFPIGSIGHSGSGGSVRSRGSRRGSVLVDSPNASGIFSPPGDIYPPAATADLPPATMSEQEHFEILSRSGSPFTMPMPMPMPMPMGGREPSLMGASTVFVEHQDAEHPKEA